MTNTFTRATLAGVFALGLVGAAHAQSIPTPANPTPRFPIATDGTPLQPNNGYGRADLLSGRGAFAPVDAGFGAANALVDDSVRVIPTR